MRKLTNIQQCEFAFKMIEALWEMAERRNKKLEKYKEGAEKYIKIKLKKGKDNET